LGGGRAVGLTYSDDALMTREIQAVCSTMGQHAV
jgi:hypothetical protein